jgi:flagellar hook-length control protein FliK
MTQAVSNLISTLSAGNTAQRSSRMADSSQTDTHSRFDQILDKTQDNRQTGKQAADTSSDEVRNGADKEKDDKTVKSKQKKDDHTDTSSDEEVTNTDAAVDQQDDHDDDMDVTDVALAAAAVQVTDQAQTQTQQQQIQQPISTAVAGTSDDPALSAALNADAPKPLSGDQKHKTTTDTQTSDDATSQKQPSVADALLRLLSVSTAQNSVTSQQQAVLNVTDGQLVQAQTSAQSTNQQAVPLPTTPQAPSDQQDSTNVARVSRALQNAIHQKGGTITIRMMPPELGQVRVDIQMHGGKVSANFQTEHESVQTLMSREMNQLRQALEKQGLTVERLQVTHRPAAGQNANASGQESQQQQTPSDGRSRGQYARQSFALTGNGSSSSEEQDSFASQLSQV